MVGPRNNDNHYTTSGYGRSDTFESNSKAGISRIGSDANIRTTSGLVSVTDADDEESLTSLLAATDDSGDEGNKFESVDNPKSSNYNSLAPDKGSRSIQNDSITPGVG